MRIVIWIFVFLILAVTVWISTALVGERTTGIGIGIVLGVHIGVSVGIALGITSGASSVLSIRFSLTSK